MLCKGSSGEGYTIIASRLAEYAVDLGTRPLSDEVVHAAKRCLVDGFAAMICGAVNPPATLMLEALAEELDHGEAQIVPSGRRAPIRTAALINGAAAHAMEVDDIFRDAVYHPGPPVISAVLAACQGKGRDGNALLRSIIAGYEVSNRVGKAMQPAHYDYWHTTGTIGTIGAAAGVAVALRLDAAQAKHALANSVTMAAALQQAFSSDSMGKPIHAGHAAEAGAMAAILAGSGVTGAEGMFEGPRGFGNAMSRDVDWQAVVSDFEHDYTITRMTQKNHTCCGHTFAAIDSMLALKHEHALSPDDVEAIHVGTYAKGVEICGNRDPKTTYEAKFSLPYAVAVGLVLGRARFAAFSEEHLHDSRIRAVMGRITFEADAAAEAAFPNRRSATVRVRTTDGREFEHHSPTRKGDPDNPLSDTELEEKYRELVEPVTGAPVADALLGACWQLENLDDVRKLPYTPGIEVAQSA